MTPRKASSRKICFSTTRRTSLRKGVVLGKTGAGKAGLCIGLLEEAVMDNIPAIVVDPKGDISELEVKFDATRIALEPEPIKP